MCDFLSYGRMCFGEHTSEMLTEKFNMLVRNDFDEFEWSGNVN